MKIFKNYYLNDQETPEILLVLLISLYLILHFVSNLSKIHGFTAIAAFIAVISISLLFKFFNKTMRRSFYLTMLYVLIIVIWSSLTQGKNPFTTKWTYTAFIMLTGGFLVSRRILNSLTSRILFVLIVAVFIYCIFIQTEVEVIKDGRIFGMNRNHVSAYLITLSSLIYITDYLKNKEKIVIWPAILTLLLSIKSLSRTGTAIAAMLFITVFFIYSRNHFRIYYAEKIQKNKTLELIHFLILITVIILVSIFTFQHSRFSTESIMSTSTVERIEFTRHFFKELTYKNAIIGFQSGYLAQSGHKHLHNSFLQLWMIAGIAAFPAFVAIVWMLYYYYRNAKFLFIILSLFCLACMSEAIFFFRYPDLILFSLWFIAVNNTLDKEKIYNTQKKP